MHHASCHFDRKSITYHTQVGWCRITFVNDWIQTAFQCMNNAVHRASVTGLGKGQLIYCNLSTHQTQQVGYSLLLLRHAPLYINNLLTAVDDVPFRSALRDASKGIFFVPRTRLKQSQAWWEGVFCRCSTSVELSSGWTQNVAFHSSVQACAENFFHFRIAIQQLIFLIFL